MGGPTVCVSGVWAGVAGSEAPTRPGARGVSP